MTIKVSQAFKDALIRYCDPHCIGWAQAKAALWGMADDHDLDEPVPLTAEVPCRIRYSNSYSGGEIISDRSLSMKTLRCGRDVQLRFTFASGQYFETPLEGVKVITPSAWMADISFPNSKAITHAN